MESQSGRIRHKLEESQKILGIEFAPINLPWERRMQTFSAVLWFTLFIGFPIASIPLCIYVVFFTQYYWIVLAYFLWVILDRNCCERGARSKDFLRGLKVWNYLRDYFPVKLVKTANLDPRKNYLFCSHPHGVLGTGLFSCFATDAHDLKALFPGLKFHLLTLSLSFFFMLSRDIILCLGVCSATRKSMNYLLSDPKGGQAAFLVPGGASECLCGKNELELKNRKGFIKVALQNGSDIVPSFSFGETDIYGQFPNPRGSLVRNVQNKIQQTLQIPPLPFYGRGIFQYTFGLLPRRRPITLVVGAPIPVTKIDNPTPLQVEDLHVAYVKALQELFYKYRGQYAADPLQDLIIV